jgi:hypothetical protein
MSSRIGYHAPPRLQECYVRAVSETRAHPGYATLISVTTASTIIVFDSIFVISKNVLRLSEEFASMFDKAEDEIQDLFSETGGGA